VVTLPVKATLIEGFKLSLSFLKASPFVFLLFVFLSHTNSQFLNIAARSYSIQNVAYTFLLTAILAAVYFLLFISLVFYTLGENNKFQLNKYIIKLYLFYFVVELFNLINHLALGLK
jgi:hypothetical protein